MPGKKKDIDKTRDDLVREIEELRRRNAELEASEKERKRSEDERRKLEEQLRQSQKIEAVGNLSSGIAHDFNNLLTVINGHAEFALMKIEGNHPLYKDIRSIFDAGKRAENLIKQLLAFSRKQIYETRILDINQVITGFDRMMRRLIGEDICMDMLFGLELPPIKADPIQIEQILVNLIINARDAVKKRAEIRGGTEKKITIETDRIYLDETYSNRHPGIQAGMYVFLAVSDTGIGMDEETKNKIFEPFFTTKEKGKGTGLGMATVYGIVKQNNGHIYVYSEPGQGTTIKIYWPSTVEKQAAGTAGKVKEYNLTGNETILLVEDDEPVRKFAGETLKELGYAVFEAANGKIAMDLIKEEKIRIDLLFTDLIMPAMNGKELAGGLKKMFPEAAILYTSGYTDNQLMHNGGLGDGFHFIQKPYSFQGLGRKVRSVIDEVKIKKRTTSISERGRGTDENKKSAAG